MDSYSAWPEMSIAMLPSTISDRHRSTTSRRSIIRSVAALPTRLLAALALILLSGCATLITASSGPAPMDSDRSKRTWGAIIEDEAIETKILVNLYKDNVGFREGNVTVVSFNGVVALLGQVPNETLKQRASMVARNIRHVQRVHNELTIAGPISHLARVNDAWITSKVKARMFLANDFPGRRVKVVTEAGSVYLMGLLTPAQADQAVHIVRRVYGVQRIVKIFETP